MKRPNTHNKGKRARLEGALARREADIEMYESDKSMAWRLPQARKDVATLRAKLGV